MTTNDYHHEEISARFASLRERIAARTITRRKWRDRDSAGRERVCLLLALAAEVRTDDGDYEPARCPAWLLPLWLSELTPWIDDASSEAAWPAMLLRYADVVGRAALVLDAAAWRRCNFATRRAAVLVAREATNDASASAACDRVVALCDRVIAGDEPRAEEWRAAGEVAAAARATAGEAVREAARATALAAAWTTAAQEARAAAGAAAAAWAAAEAASRAASGESAGAAAGAASWAVVRAAEAAAEAAWAAAGEAARAAARAAGGADRIIDACLTAIERELARAMHSISGGGL